MKTLKTVIIFLFGENIKREGTYWEKSKDASG